MDQAKDITPDEKNQRIGDINKSFTKCKEYGDDKLSLAMQTYDMIDINKSFTKCKEYGDDK